MSAADRRSRMAAKARRRRLAEARWEQVSFALELFPERDWNQVVLDSSDMDQIRRAIAQEQPTTRRGLL